ncbi:MAG TPA: hypothetical protein VFH41_05715 [Bradyrhizobium sp.]|nr:hypothetical protein [Bradyrhizobium sp.]
MPAIPRHHGAREVARRDARGRKQLEDKIRLANEVRPYLSIEPIPTRRRGDLSQHPQTQTRRIALGAETTEEVLWSSGQREIGRQLDLAYPG